VQDRDRVWTGPGEDKAEHGQGRPGQDRTRQGRGGPGQQGRREGVGKGETEKKGRRGRQTQDRWDHKHTLTMRNDHSNAIFATTGKEKKRKEKKSNHSCLR
jgi:hypothetical protein